jgi:putative transposase
MQNRPGHRKQVRHSAEERCVHELTFSCYQRMQLLTDDLWRGMLGDAVTRATENHEFDLIAFVWMPEHVHLLVLPRSRESRISALLNAIKRPFSYRVKQLLIEKKSPLLDRLTIRQRPGVMTFRFWQEGGGYDRNLWTPSAIRSAVDYIHLNPVRRGFCEKPSDWRWSSARFYDDEISESDADLPRIDGINWHTLE